MVAIIRASDWNRSNIPFEIKLQIQLRWENGALARYPPSNNGIWISYCEKYVCGSQQWHKRGFKFLSVFSDKDVAILIFKMPNVVVPN